MKNLEWYRLKNNFEILQHPSLIYYSKFLIFIHDKLVLGSVEKVLG